jgi:hypothetical protein
MKTYKNIFKATSLLAVMSLSLASCNDWLTVHPQTQIVEENFWEDKNDLEGVRYAAYKNMAGQVEKMIIWGDLRSDVYRLNTQQSSKQGNRDNFRNIIQANIDTTWSYYDWSGMYSTIGYCNKVIQHGEEVLEKDKQFTASEWRQMKAEMVTMRALSYFYLVRAFKSIPYTTKVVNSDTEVEYFPQLPVLDVMDSLITDVESVAGQARNRFVDKQETKGMITNAAIYALLSDMYLWRASLRQGRSAADSTITQAMVIDDYQKCILNSELSISKLKEQFDEDMKGNIGASRENYMSWAGAPLFNGKSIDFMYKNDVDEANRGYVNLNAYREIFNNGNSYESIFELQFSSSDSRKNETVNSMWGSSEGTHLVTTFSSDNKTDMRYWFSGWKNIGGALTAADYYCLKWNNPLVVFTSGIGTEQVEIAMIGSTDEYNNWIVYRLSDVLLQNAEARACLVQLGVDAADNKTVCQQILRMINRRWWVDVVNGGEAANDVATKKDYDIDATVNGNDAYIKHVMDTRKIEFVGEGKRWFDLVRYAERLSDSDESEAGMRDMYDTFMNIITGYETARNRCENLWGLYSPIYYMECKAYRAGGSNITQNPVWNKSKYDR